MSNDKKFLGVRDLSRELQLSRRVVIALIKSGRLPAINTGLEKPGHYKVLKSDAAAFKRHLEEIPA